MVEGIFPASCQVCALECLVRGSACMGIAVEFLKFSYFIEAVWKLLARRIFTMERLQLEWLIFRGFLLCPTKSIELYLF